MQRSRDPYEQIGSHWTEPWFVGDVEEPTLLDNVTDNGLFYICFSSSHGQGGTKEYLLKYWYQGQLLTEKIEQEDDFVVFYDQHQTFDCLSDLVEACRSEVVEPLHCRLTETCVASKGVSAADGRERSRSVPSLRQSTGQFSEWDDLAEGETMQGIPLNSDHVYATVSRRRSHSNAEDLLAPRPMSPKDKAKSEAALASLRPKPGAMVADGNVDELADEQQQRGRRRSSAASRVMNMLGIRRRSRINSRESQSTSREPSEGRSRRASAHRRSVFGQIGHMMANLGRASSSPAVETERAAAHDAPPGLPSSRSAHSLRRHGSRRQRRLLDAEPLVESPEKDLNGTGAPQAVCLVVSDSSHELIPALAGGDHDDDENEKATPPSVPEPMVVGGVHSRIDEESLVSPIYCGYSTTSEVSDALANAAYGRYMVHSIHNDDKRLALVCRTQRGCVRKFIVNTVRGITVKGTGNFFNNLGELLAFYTGHPLPGHNVLLRFEPDTETDQNHRSRSTSVASDRPSRHEAMPWFYDGVDADSCEALLEYEDDGAFLVSSQVDSGRSAEPVSRNECNHPAVDAENGISEDDVTVEYLLLYVHKGRVLRRRVQHTAMGVRFSSGRSFFESLAVLISSYSTSPGDELRCALTHTIGEPPLMRGRFDADRSVNSKSSQSSLKVDLLVRLHPDMEVSWWKGTAEETRNAVFMLQASGADGIFFVRHGCKLGSFVLTYRYQRMFRCQLIQSVRSEAGAWTLFLSSSRLQQHDNLSKLVYRLSRSRHQPLPCPLALAEQDLQIMTIDRPRSASQPERTSAEGATALKSRILPGEPRAETSAARRRRSKDGTKSEDPRRWSVDSPFDVQRVSTHSDDTGRQGHRRELPGAGSEPNLSQSQSHSLHQHQRYHPRALQPRDRRQRHRHVNALPETNPFTATSTPTKAITVHKEGSSSASPTATAQLNVSSKDSGSEELHARPLSLFVDATAKAQPWCILAPRDTPELMHRLRDAPDGAFLVRVGRQHVGSLSMVVRGMVHRYKVDATSSGLRLRGSKDFFPNLTSLVRYYASPAQNALPCPLRLPSRRVRALHSADREGKRTNTLV